MGAGIFAMGLAALVVAGAARAETPRTTPADWAVLPSADDLADLYPPMAQALGIEGRALLSCDVDAAGKLQSCRAASDSPAGLGFGQAALELSATFRMRPARVDGHPVEGGRVRIPIRFSLPASEPPAPSLPQASAATLTAARQAAQLSGLVFRLMASREAEIRLLAASSEGMDQDLLAEAVAALRAANLQAEPRILDLASRSIAARLTPAEIEAWVTSLDSAAARKLGASEAPMERAFAPILALHARTVSARARAVFCRRQDCTLETSLADMKRLAEAPEAVVDKPRWASEPTAADALAAYPLIARVFRINGWAVSQCRVMESGGLASCENLVKAPSRLGFGAAALRVADRYQLDPGQLALGAAGDRVNLPTFFSITADPPPARVAPKPSPSLSLAREIARFEGAVRRADLAAEQGQWLLSHAEGHDAEVRRDAGEAYRGAMIEDLPARLDDIAAVYTRFLSESELRTIAAFAHSRTGNLVTGRDEAFNALVLGGLEDILAAERDAARTAFCGARDCAMGDLAS